MTLADVFDDLQHDLPHAREHLAEYGWPWLAFTGVLLVLVITANVALGCLLWEKE